MCACGVLAVSSCARRVWLWLMVPSVPAHVPVCCVRLQAAPAAGGAAAKGKDAPAAPAAGRKRLRRADEGAAQTKPKTQVRQRRAKGGAGYAVGAPPVTGWLLVLILHRC